MKTRAAILKNVGGPLVIEELEIPKLERGQVLVKILYSGLCRSNLNEINGRKGAEFIPHLTGHEASGVVVEIGVGVSKLKPDDYVVCSWIKGKGLDNPSVKYRSAHGMINAGACSTFIEWAIISENRLVKIPKEADPVVVALLGCAVPTGAGIVDRLDAKPGQKLAVFGIGGIGASALLRASSMGMECSAFDVKQWKLVWVESLGLGIKTFDISIICVPLSRLEFGSFDFAIECSGSEMAMLMAFKCLKSNGTAVIAGNLEPGKHISIDPFELIKGKKLRGTWGGECFLDKDIPFYVSEYLKGNLPIGKLITEVYSFDQINQGLKDLEEGKLIRGIVQISE